jgi:nitroreductase
MIETIMTRTSIRAYEERPVEDEKVETLLRAAMAAPSACNKQPWRFVVIKNRQTLKNLAEQFSNMPMVGDAALAIVVCGDMNHTMPEEGQTYWIQDAAAATENILLAAHAIGLGAVWCGIYPRMERVASLKGLLGMPDNIVPFSVIPMGYPAESRAPKDKWNPGNVHYEVW